MGGGKTVHAILKRFNPKIALFYYLPRITLDPRTDRNMPRHAQENRYGRFPGLNFWCSQFIEGF